MSFFFCQGKLPSFYDFGVDNQGLQPDGSSHILNCAPGKCLESAAGTRKLSGWELGPPELQRLNGMGPGEVVLSPDKTFCEALKLIMLKRSLEIRPLLPLTIGQGRPAPGGPKPSASGNELAALLGVERPWPPGILRPGGPPRPQHGWRNSLWRGWIVPADSEPCGHQMLASQTHVLWEVKPDEEESSGRGRCFSEPRLGRLR